VGRFALIAVLGVVFLAGCGGSSLYTVGKTRSCLSSEAAHIGNITRFDFVASTATGGAFTATLSDNSVTISFGSRESDAADIATAYQRLAFSNVRNNIQHVLERYQNVVLLWHVHPANADLALVTGCLK
jgi:hypothetical protein